MKLSTGLNQFFVQYLPRIKGSSEKTIHSYRDAYRLLLPFAADYYHIKIASLRIEHLSVEMIIAFLNHLEEKRKNTARTRNLRLVAIKSLAKMIRFMYPQHRQLAQQILNIPQKRMQKKLIGYLYPEEIMNVFNVVDLKKSEGLRDYCLLHLLFDSGARATEVATLNLDYFDDHNQTLAISGKGNRFRQIELWPNVPANPPAETFWSATIYDVNMRTLIKTDQKNPTVGSIQGFDKNPDGSVTIYVGPDAPKGKERNWIKTIPGQGWFSYFRLYSPTEPFFDGRWVLPDIEEAG